MTTIVTRAGKGSPLTNNEVDTNFTNLNTAKIETLTSTDTSVTITGTGSSRDLSVPVNPNVVSGPASATDNAVARFDTTTGKLIQNSSVTLDDNGNVQNVNSVGYDTTPGTLPTVAGTAFWDDGNGTEAILLKGGNVTLQVGQEIVVRAYNDSGVALTDGQIVYISGAQGNRVAIKLALATTDGTSAGTLGMVTEPIAIGAEGFITILGTVNGLNTIGLTQGAIVYLSPTTAGAYTTTKPVAPQHSVTVGYVERVHATVGSIYVKVDNGYELDELHNVLITSAASGNTLIYDAVAGVWKNANLTAGTGISVTGSAGSITVANTGVTSVAGTANEVEVSASTGSVTIGLPATTVAAGSYTNTSLTVDANGRLTAASSGTAPVTSVSGTAGRVTSTGGTTPVIDLASGVATAGTTGSSTLIPVVTIDTYGRVTGITTAANPQGTVTSVTGTAPVVSSGGATPAISMAAANTTTNGYLTSTDWNTFNNKQPAGSYLTSAVTSATAGTGISVSASTGAVTFTNTAPDQTVGLTAGSGISVTGTYPNFTIANTAGGATISDDTTTNATRYPLYAAATSGTASTVYTSSTKYTFNPSTGSLTVAGDVTSSSDERVKENWRSLPVDFLAQLASVKSGIYDRNDLIATQAGVSAQSLQQVLPQTVTTDADGMLSVAYGNAALVAAIELAKEVTALRKELNELKGKG